MKRSLGVDIAFHLKVMFWVALWVPSDSNIAKFLYGIFTLFTGAMVCGFLLSQLLNIALGHFNLILFVHSLATIAPCVKVLLILIKFTFTKEDVENLIKNFNTLRSNWRSSSETENKILDSAEKESRLMTNGLLSGYVILMIFMSVKPLVFQDTYMNNTNLTDIHPERSFVVLSWYPWDTRSTTMYAVTYISQIYALYVVIIQVAVFQTFNTAILIHIAAEFKLIYQKFTSILNQNTYNHAEESKNIFSHASNSTCDVKRSQNKNTIRKRRCEIRKGIRSEIKSKNHVKEGGEKPYSEYANDSGSNIFSINYDKPENEAYERLIEIVKHHQNVLRFCEEFGTIFRSLYLFQFSTVIFGLCFSCFLASLPSVDSETRMQFIIFTGLLMAQLLLPCWYGQRVTDQAELIRDAVYSCRWYDESARFKKAVHIIIMVCQRPISFSIGGFAAISRETWLSLINFTYSILAVLRHMDVDKFAEN
ncbi:Odorant receptor 114 [Blattella germanica]|nr:Odorant receptor 114 [Blattella germanica]